MTSFRGLTWVGASIAAFATALGGGCTTENKLAVIPCNMQEHCTPHGLICDLQVGQCAQCLGGGTNCLPTGNGGSTGTQGGSGPGNGGSSDGGSNPSGGMASGGNGSGGVAGSSAGGTAGNGAGGSSGGPPCSPVTGSASDLVIYNGAVCDDRLNAPRTGFWFSFNDGTGLQVPTQPHNGVSGGMGGGADCMMRSQGDGFTDWGGSFKLWLNASGGQTCTYDATNYQGIRFYMRGSATGTSGAAFVSAENTLRVNVPTQSTSSSGQGGTCVGTCDDSFGKWCTVTSSWALCELPFDTITQGGWGTAALFSKNEILGLQIQASRYMSAVNVSWDLYVDDVTFY